MLLETERTFLSPWAIEDQAAFAPIATDPAVMRYITGGVPWTAEQVREFVERQIRHFMERKFCMWKLLLKETGRLSGFCGIQPMTELPRIPGHTGPVPQSGTGPEARESEVEIGWWLAQDCWGRGLATEAAREVLRDAWERAGLHRIVAVAMPGNRASRHIMDKLGMRYERDTVVRDVPVVLYAIERPAPVT